LPINKPKTALVVRIFNQQSKISNQKCFYRARLMQISPVDVCTFSIGPPPFSLPSAVSVFGP
jgi:hypothetical protein